MMRLKKGIAVLMLSAVAIPTFAQSGSSDFSPYWYAGLQGGVGLTIGEASIGKLLTPAAAVSGGYRFSSLFGARASISGWQGKGSSITDTYKFNYLQGSVDLTLDAASLFSGYKSDRFISPYAFAGIGLVGAFNNDEAIALSESGYLMSNLWSGKELFIAGRAGLGANFKISDRVAFNLEFNGNGLPDKFNSKDAPNIDWQCNALAGITIRFGSTKSSAKSAASAPAKQQPAANTPAKQQPAANTPAKQQPTANTPAKQQPTANTPAKQQPANTPAKDVKIASKSVLFNINSATPSATQSKVVDEIAAIMKSNPSKKLTVTGYADATTGTSSYNMAISKKRAEGVRNLLVAKGVSVDRITVDYKGDTVQPKAVVVENRTVICEFK